MTYELDLDLLRKKLSRARLEKSPPVPPTQEEYEKPS